ncbi:MAG: excisionase family DNA-binding protein [Elusimicrobia bacterium]|nr:excisionase family DNA-binding protein [Elusimicrobiota bacterium]
MKNYITVSQAAKLLGISRVAVFKKIKKGEIKAIRIGRIYAIPESLIENIFHKKISKKEKKLIEKAVKRVVRDYGETLRMLGNE